VVFVAEWGDITQFTTANLAARYDPLLVFAGATLGLWAVAAVEIITLITFYAYMKSRGFDFDITKLSKLKW